jgi:hypothetical protein
MDQPNSDNILSSSGITILLYLLVSGMSMVVPASAASIPAWRAY